MSTKALPIGFSAFMAFCGSAALLCSPLHAQNTTASSLIQTGSFWKFFATGSAPAETWRSANFDDSSWIMGRAPLGYGEPDIATFISPATPLITVYFRHWFPLTNAASVTQLVARVKIDDGVVLYLNGVEALRANMPTGPVTHETFALSAVEPTYREFLIPAAMLLSGNNLVAAEVHNVNVSSSDLYFEMELLGLTGGSNTPPTVRIVSPADESTFIAPADITLIANAQDRNGYETIKTVEFFEGTNSLGITTNLPVLNPLGPFVLTWPNVPPGRYRFTAIAVDDAGNKGVSDPVDVTVLPPPEDDVWRGFVTWNVYTNVPGLGLSNLLQHPNFPDNPSSVSLLPAFETRSNIGDNYGSLVFGFLFPPVTGEYVFYLASDDQGELYLSSDTNPEHKVSIAKVTTWRPPRAWVGPVFGETNGENVSVPIQLEAGKSYYIEALHKEGGGGDNLAVAWQRPGEPPPENGAPPIPGEFLGTFAWSTNVVVVTATDPEATEPNLVPPGSLMPVLWDPGTFSVQRRGDLTQALEVQARLSGTASNGVDYTTISVPIVIPAGEDHVAINVEPLLDLLVEGDESAVLTLLPGRSYLVSPNANQARITIHDTPGPDRVFVNVRATDPEAAEISPLLTVVPNTGEFVLTRTGPTNFPLTVFYHLGGTASNGLDYVTLPTSVVIPEGSRETKLVVNVIDDQLFEGTETVNLQVTAPACITVVPPPLECYLPGTNSFARVLIADDERIDERVRVGVIAADPVAAEIDPRLDVLPNTGLFVFTRTGPTNFPLTVYVNFGGTASNGVDYVKLSETVVIPVGERQAGLFVQAIDDLLAEGSESVIAEVKAPVCVTVEPPSLECYLPATNRTARVTILDNEESTNNAPTVAIVSPADGTTYVAPVTVELIAEAHDPDGFADIRQVEFYDGTMRIGVVSNSLELLAAGALDGGVMRVFVLPWANVPVGNHLLFAHAVDRAGYRGVSEPIHITVVGDPEDPPLVNVIATDPHASETGMRSAIDPGRFVITRSRGTNVNLEVAFALTGTAENGRDYRYITNRTIIPRGSYQRAIEVSVLEDALVEPTETVVLTVLPPVNVFDPSLSAYRVGISNSATVTIADATVTNQVPIVSITSPVSGAAYTAPADIPIVAKVRDPDGYSSHVDFYADGGKIGEVTLSFLVAPPPGTEITFEWTCRNAPVGEHRLSARARDDRGAYGTSPDVPIVVRDAQATNLELHVVGVYSGTTDAGTTSRNNELGHAAVNVNRPGQRVVLLLSAYEPVLWHVTVAPETVLDRVILAGYYRQSIEGIPLGTPVSHYEYEGNVPGYFWAGYQVDSCTFYQAAPRIRSLTGLEIASFQGAYQAPYPSGFTVNAVQSDPRLRSDYPTPVPGNELPTQAEFNLSFFRSGAPVFQRSYTLAGPSGGGRLLPDMLVVPGDAGHYYGIQWHGVTQVDGQTGATREMNVGPGVPELSWPMGITYDTQRERVLLASLGGEGYLYAYNPAQDTWSVVSSMHNRDVSSIVYHAPQDALYALEVTHSDSGPARLFKFDANGAFVSEMQLPYLPCGIGPGGNTSELVSVGDYLVLIWSPEHVASYGDTKEERMYLIDPRTQEVWLTYRNVPVPVNRPPVVQLVSPTPGSVLPAGQTIQLRATAYDPDGVVRSVEFLANERSLGFGQRARDITTGDVYVLGWVNPAAGSYTLTARAIDGQGATASSSAVRISVQGDAALPVVSIFAIDGLAREGILEGHTNIAVFRVLRAGPTNSALTVSLEIGGTAQNGVDYRELAQNVTIQAGRRAAEIVLQPLEDNITETMETVTLRLLESATYQVGSPNSAGAILVDTDETTPVTTSLTGRLVYMRLPASDGWNLRVEASTNLVDWVPMVTDVAVEDGGVHFVDPDAANQPYRYYRLAPIPQPASLVDQ